jgi:hypothetical protein
VELRHHERDPGLLQEKTGKDFMPFFEKYYWSIEMPKD